MALIADGQHPLVIAHVVAPAPVGGLERVVRGLATGHAARGHSVHIINVFDRGEAIRPIELEAASGVTSHVVEIPRGRYWRERGAVARLCRSNAVRILHTHGYRPDVLDSPVARAVGARCVTTVHGFVGGSLKTRLFESLQVRRFRRFDAVVAVSRRLAELLAARGVGAARLHCIPNAWAGSSQPLLARAEARAALGIPGAGPCLGWVGRLSREKGADVLLDALARARELRCTAAIVGDGRDAGALHQQAEALGVADQVRWCGTVPDMARCYRAFDVFVLSSRTEGTPIVLFEAMAAGIPLVVTRVGGVPDVVSEREALLVPPEDPAALADALRQVIAHPEQAAARAADAQRRLVSGFASAPWLDRYEEVYRA